MTVEEIIASGKLELYVCGSLPSEEVSEIEEAINAYPEVKKEVEEIETALVYLAETVAPPLSAMSWSAILESIQKVRSLKDNTKKINWAAITGWAAAIVCIGGIFWMLQQNNKLKDDIQITTIQNNEIKEKSNLNEGKLTQATELLTIIRAKDFKTVLLPGNDAVAPEAFTKVYFNESERLAYIDASGLPKAPPGKVYQVWSLKLDPLTPTSIGLLRIVEENENNIFRFENIPDSEAFGITLEPAGGSETPTLSLLYTLGTITP